MPPTGTANIIKRKKAEVAKLTYPLDIEQTGHFMVYIPKKYEYSGGKIGFKSVQIKDSFRPIVLPLPRNLSESYGASWETESIGAIASNIAQYVADDGETNMASLSNLSQNVGLEALISGGAKMIERDGAGYAAGLGASLAGSGTAGAIVSALLGGLGQGAISGVKTGFGLAANPYLALLFHGVGLRSFSFQYEFFAKSPEESIEVKKIIDRFRYCMLPSYNTSIKGSGRALFNYPEIFHIGFMQNDFLYSFKPCALTNLSINYHQQGDAFYFDLNGKKVPASIQIGLDFRELEIVIKDDFEEGGDKVRSESNFNNVLYKIPEGR